MNHFHSKPACKAIAVIVAGGKGLRMRSNVKKQFIELDGIPVLVRTLLAFDSHMAVDEIILVVPGNDLAFCRNDLLSSYAFTCPVHVIEGGITRQDSVANGLVTAQDLCTDSKETFVLVHDGVRPFVSAALVDACLETAETTGACIPAIKISDTVKEADNNGRINRTVNRDALYRAQTPQVFRLDLILEAFSKADETGFSGTDEASICEHAGIDVHLTEGDRFNIKLTTPEDLTLAKFFMDCKNV